MIAVIVILVTIRRLDDSKVKVMVLLNLDFSFVQIEKTLKTEQKTN